MSTTHVQTMDDTQVHHHAHHFADAAEEFEAAKQGMWLLLVTEVLMFGGLFVAYALFRSMYPEMFHEAHQMLNWKMGATNTVVLICSSLTMALAVTATQKGQRKKAVGLLAVTLLLAGTFLVIKYFEWTHDFSEGIYTAGFFHNTELKNPKAPLFFSLYFVMTGLHGVHVLIGMGLILWIMRRTAKGNLGSHYYTPTELVGFYWHFVDIVWIYLFPLLYLIT